jgi:hypothetical protein
MSINYRTTLRMLGATLALSLAGLGLSTIHAQASDTGPPRARPLVGPA